MCVCLQTINSLSFNSDKPRLYKAKFNNKKSQQTWATCGARSKKVYLFTKKAPFSKCSHIRGKDDTRVYMYSRWLTNIGLQKLTKSSCKTDYS